MDKEMSDKTLDARAGLNERSTGEIEHLVNLRQLCPNPVQPNGTNAPGVSKGRDALEMQIDQNPQTERN